MLLEVLGHQGPEDARNGAGTDRKREEAEGVVVFGVLKLRSNNICL